MPYRREVESRLCPKGREGVVLLFGRISFDLRVDWPESENIGGHSREACLQSLTNALLNYRIE